MLRTACPPRPELVAYSLGSLPPQEIEAIADHIDNCETCQSALATLSDPSDPLIEQLRQPLPVDEFAQEEPCRRAIARVRAFVPATDAAEGMPSPPESEPLPQLGEYLLLAKLGEGGMGAVYRAQHTKLDKLVALKVVRKDRMQDPRVVSRFEREMKAVGRLSHPNIVQAFDAREIDGTHFLAMEYVEGLDLAKLISATGALRIADACELVRQAAVGLQHAHEQGLVHRDVKPSNLMLSVVSGQWSVVTDQRQRTTGDGQLTTDFGQQAILKILDFGLSLLGVDQPNRPEMTAAGTAMGTADYVSPEQVTDSHSVDIRSDIYSLGCTLYKLLSGRAPFVGPEFKNDVTKMMAHVDKVPPPISLLRTDLPPGLAAVVERMMAKKPEDRFATPGEVTAALAPFASGCDLGRLLNEAHGILGVPTVETPPSASTGKLSGSAHVDTATSAPLAPARPSGKQSSSPLAPVIRGEGPGVRAGSGRRRIWIALAAAAAAIPLLLGIWVIIRDKQGKEVARMQVPEGGSVEHVDDQGQSVKPSGAASVTQKPVRIEIQSQPLPPRKPGEPLAITALVGRPAALPGVRSWTIDTIGHRSAILCVAYCPTGRLVVTGGEDGVIRLWDREKGLERALLGHPGAVSSVSWSPDGHFLASGGEGTVAVWNGATGQLLRSWQAYPNLRVFCRWSPDGGKILTWGFAGGPPRLWDASDGKQLLSFDKCWNGEWSPDGAMCMCRDQSEPNVPIILDANTGGVIRRLEGLTGAVQRCAWSPDGQTIATESLSGETSVHLWNAETGTQTATVKLGPPSDFAWSRDSSRLAVAGASGTAIVDRDTAQVSRTLNSWALSCLSWSPDGKELVTAGGDAVVRIYDPDNGGELCRFNGYPGCLASVCLSPDGHALATGDNACPAAKIAFWDLASDTRMHGRRTPHTAAALGAWSPDGKSVASASGTTLQVWDWTTGQCVWTSETSGPKWCASWSPSGKLLATGGYYDSSVQIWDVGTHKCLAELSGHTGRVYALSWSPNEETLASSSGGTAQVWNVSTATLLHTLEDSALEHSLAWTPDGERVLTVSRGQVKTWKAATGELISYQTSDHACRISWLPDSKTMVLSGYLGKLTFWDAELRELRQTVSLPSPASSLIVPSPDARTVVNVFANAVMLWDVDTRSRRATLVNLSDDQWFALSGDGHYRGSPGIERELVYIVETDQGQETMSPAEFAKRYGWKNDPAKVTMLPEPSQQQPAASGESPKHADQPKPAESNP